MFLRLGSYFANSASCENGTFFKNLTDWTTGNGLTSTLYTAVTETASLSWQACQDRLWNMKHVVCVCDCWSLNSELVYACYGYLIPLLLWPGRVGLSQHPCSDVPTSLSQQSSIHTSSFIYLWFIINFCLPKVSF